MSKDKHKKHSRKHRSKNKASTKKVKSTNEHDKKAELISGFSESASPDAQGVQPTTKKGSWISKIVLGGMFSVLFVGIGVSLYFGQMAAALTLGVVACVVPAFIMYAAPSVPLTSISEESHEKSMEGEANLGSKLVNLLANKGPSNSATRAVENPPVKEALESTKGISTGSQEELEESLSDSDNSEEASELESEDSFDVSMGQTKPANQKEFEQLTTNPSYKNLFKLT